MVDIVLAILAIILFDLLLSGDNAVVIGMAARRLSPENRRKAIVWGGVGAIGLRIFFTIIVSWLLDIPYLLLVGGLLLLWVAYKLLKPHDEHANVSEANSLGEAVRTIILADVVMSLDNILAVASASHGGSDDTRTRTVLILFGLALSIPVLLLGSALVARILNRYPILVYIGAVVLVWAAGRMIVEDDLIHDLYAFAWWETLLLSGIVSAVIIALGVRAQRLATPHEFEEQIEESVAPDIAAEAAAERREQAGEGATLRSPNWREPITDRPEARRPTP